MLYLILIQGGIDFYLVFKLLIGFYLGTCIFLEGGFEELLLLVDCLQLNELLFGFLLAWRFSHFPLFVVMQLLFPMSYVTLFKANNHNKITINLIQYPHITHPYFLRIETYFRG